LIVDDVIGLQTLPGSAIEPAAPGEAEAGCTAGITRCAGRSFVVLDLVRLVAAHSSTSPEAPSFREGEMASG
jgi:chemotaxis signal transduction protein